MSAERAAFGVALCVAAAAAALAKQPLTDALSAPGAPASQRALAGGTAGVNPRLTRPLRVALLDGLNRADAPRVASFAAVCARGAEVTVDVGFPSKSLAVQRTLWSGLTSQQTGDAYGNDPSTPPPSSVAILVPGSFAVVESHASIARSVGFPVVGPLPEGDSDDPLAQPGQVAAWQGGGFVTAARDAVASAAPLVLVHVLAIDEAAHRSGRGSRDHTEALAAADAALGAVVDAAPDAQWLVLSDHGHVPTGGHGDAESEVRRVTACWAPAPAGAGPGELHLVDLARWIADSLGAPRHPHAVGRALPVALAHPDPDATLPHPSWPARLAALLLLLSGFAAAAHQGDNRSHGPRLQRALGWWPVVTAVIVLAVHGLPTLSHRVPLWLVAGATAGPCAIATVSGIRTGWSGGRTMVAMLAVIVASALGVAILSGCVGAVLGGPPARVPWWTGVLGATAGMVGVAAATVGAILVGDGVIAAVRRVRSAGHRRPGHGR